MVIRERELACRDASPRERFWSELARDCQHGHGHNREQARSYATTCQNPDREGVESAYPTSNIAYELSKILASQARARAKSNTG